MNEDNSLNVLNIIVFYYKERLVLYEGSEEIQNELLQRDNDIRRLRISDIQKLERIRCRMFHFDFNVSSQLSSEVFILIKNTYV